MIEILVMLCMALLVGAFVWMVGRRDSSPDVKRTLPPARERQCSPLGAAIAARDSTRARELLAEGADPNASAMDDLPALHVAARSSMPSLVTALVAAGAVVDHCDPRFGGAVSLALVAGENDAMVDALLDAGVPVDLANDGGAQALHVAALCGRLDVVRRLLDHGAQVDAVNHQGGTALRSAASEGHAAIVELLLERGAHPSPVDSFGKRPIDYAREGSHTGVVRMLRSAERSEPPPTPVPPSCFARMLPARRDATLNAVREMLEKGLTISQCAASSLEAPTLIFALREVLSPSFSVAAGIDEPDPRLPARDDVDLLLFTYDDLEPRPNLAAPPREVMSALEQLASSPYHLGLWSKRAAEVARSLRDTPLPEVLAVMAHAPAERPAYLEPWDYRLRVQVAAALVASHHDDVPWVSSIRRRALEDVADGPADWSNTAAVIALFDVARRDADARASVVETLLGLARRRQTPPAFQHAIEPAAFALLELGGLDVETTRELAALVRIDVPLEPVDLDEA